MIKLSKEYTETGAYMENQKKNSLLIVDDQEINTAILANILSSDYTVFEETDGEKALKTAEAELPDVILLDIIMPGMDGFEVLAELKRNPKTEKIPVIFTTSLGGEGDEEKGLSFGAADYITKPFSPATVKLRVQNQIKMLNYIAEKEQLADKLEKEAEETRKAKELTMLMLDSAPLCAQIWDINLNTMDCNEAAVRLYKFKSKQEYIERFITDCSPEYQPDGRLSSEKAVELVNKAFKDGYWSGEWMHRIPDGNELMPAEVTLVRVVYENDYAVVGYTRDLREQKKMQAQIEYRDRMLYSANQAAAVLLNSDTETFEECLCQSMRLMADVTDTHCVYIWKNILIDNEPHCFQLIEWSETATKFTDQTPYNYNEVVPGWYEILSKGNFINSFVKNMSREEQDHLQGILSILVLPIFVEDSFWGFVGFDDKKKERTFTEEEISILRSTGLLIANALLRNEMTDNIQKAEEKLERIVDNLPGIVFQGRFNLQEQLYSYTFMSKGCEELFGYTREELLGATMTDLQKILLPEDVEKFIMQLAAYREKDRFEGINRIVCKNGAVRWIWERSRVIERNADNTEYIIEGYVTDITELRELQAKIERIVDNLPGMVFQSYFEAPSYPYTFVSKGCEKLLGYTQQELLDEVITYDQMLVPEDAIPASVYEEAYSADAQFEETYRLTCKDGSVKWMWESSRVIERKPDGTPHLIEGYVVDVTEKFELERKIKRIIDNLPGMVFQSRLTPDAYSYILASKGCEELFGYTPEEITGGDVSFSGKLHPEDIAILNEHFDAYKKGGEYEGIFRILCKDGRYKWIWERSRVIESNADGTEIIIEGYATDITEQHELKSEIERIVDNLPGMVFRHLYNPPKFDFTFVSKGCELLLGYTQEEMMSGTGAVHFDEMLHSDDMENIADIYGAYTDNAPYEAFYRLRRKDGATKWVWERSTAIERNPDGSPALVEGYITDVTERYELQNKIARIVDNLPGMVYNCEYKSPDYPLTFVSKGCYGLIGYMPEELVGGVNMFQKLIHPDDVPLIEEKCAQTLTFGDPYEFKYRLLMPDGRIKWVWERTRVVEKNPDGSTRLVEGYVFDVSDRYQLEASEASNKAKSEFLAHMSHEIRTPMNSIMGFAELALECADTPETRDYLQKIIDNSKWLLNIINDILDISKIESGKMELERTPFDLPDVISRCHSVILPSLKDKGIEMSVYSEVSSDKRLIGDSVKLYQALMNLLSNAVKFTKEGYVKLSAAIKASDDIKTTVYFEVKDTGIGMTAEQVKRVFEPFMQADLSTTRNYGGTGLGLTITKNIVELMNSKLMVESTPGEGSKFFFEVVFDTTDAPNENQRFSKADKLEKPLFDAHILICEDNRLNQKVVCAHLAQVGIKTTVADNGKIAVDMVASRMQKGETPFDLIFMDMFMPVMDGMEAASKIKELNSGTPIIAMTANVMASELEKYRANGMPDCLGKPFSSQELWRMLLKYLKPIAIEEINPDAAQTEGNAFMNELKINFYRSNLNKITEISEALVTGDIKLAHRLAHTLKSNAGQIGQIKLQKAAEDAERLLEDPQNKLNEVFIAPYIEILNAELISVLAEITPLLYEAEEKGEAKSLTEEQTRELFARLEPLLENADPDCIKLLDEIRALPDGEQLAKEIDDYEFEIAAVTLAELKEKYFPYAK